MGRYLFAATAILCTVLAAHAQGPAAAPAKASAADFAQCAATAARKAQLLKETGQVLGLPVSQLRESAALVPRYFRIACALSTVASTHDAFDKAQDRYDVVVKQVAESCRTAADCLPVYLRSLQARLDQCAGFVDGQKDLIDRLVPVSQAGCRIEFEP